MNKDTAQRIAEVRQDVYAAIHKLNTEYVGLLLRLGCKRVTLHRF